MKIKLTIFFVSVCLLTANAQVDPNTSRAGLWPYGFAYSATIHENYIFTSHGRAVQYYDITNPDEPLLKGDVFIDDMASTFAIANQKAYVGGYKGLYIMEYSVEGHLETIASMPLSTAVRDIYLIDTYAYILLANIGIGIVDVSDAYNPVMLDTLETSYACVSIEVNENLAWIAAGESGIKAFDISNPLSPELVLNHPLTGTTRSIAIEGGQLYVINNHQGILVFDIGELPELTLLSTTPLMKTGSNVAVANDILAVNIIMYGCVLYDISNPAAPDSIYAIPGDWPYIGVDLKDNLLMQNIGTDIRLFDLGNPQEVELLSEMNMTGHFQEFCYWNNHVYGNGYKQKLLAVDVSDPLQTVKTFEESSGYMSHDHGIYANDNLLFLEEYYRLLIYGLSDPSNPVLIDTITIATSTISAMHKHNNLLFISDNYELHVYDIANIHTPVLLDVFPEGDIREMVVQGNYLYAVQRNHFFIFDISDPGNLVLLNNTYIERATSLVIRDNLVYIGCETIYSYGQLALKIFNVENPASAVLVKQMDHGGKYIRMKLDGDYLYILDITTGLRIYDLENPVNPVFCGYYKPGYQIWDLEVGQGVIYVSLRHGFDIVVNHLLTSAGGMFIERDQRLLLYPNPASQSINFELDDKSYTNTFTYEIVKMDGAATLSGKLAAGQRQLSLDGLPGGVYILRLISEGKLYKSGLFVKQ